WLRRAVCQASRGPVSCRRHCDRHLDLGKQRERDSWTTDGQSCWCGHGGVRGRRRRPACGAGGPRHLHSLSNDCSHPGDAPAPRPHTLCAPGKGRAGVTDRFVTSRPSDEDAQYEAGLRPRSLSEYIGQDRLRDNLQVSIEAARGRREALDHVLLYGPAGLGKTTLAYVIANEMGVPIRGTAGPVIERPGDLAGMLTDVQEHAVLFIDEIHRMAPAIEEILYPAMEDYELDIVIGQGPSARSVKVPLQKFTLIGATTRAGLLTSPLRARFGIVHRLDFYGESDVEEIVRRSARILGVTVQPDAAIEIARRSRGTPRIANRLLRRVRDYAQVRADGVVTGDVARAALAMLEVDDHGFDEVDRKLLRTIIDKFSGGRVGANTTPAAINEERDAIEDIYEPFLIQAGFLYTTR